MREAVVPRGQSARLVGCVLLVVAAIGCARHPLMIAHPADLPGDAHPTPVVPAVRREPVEITAAPPVPALAEDRVANRTLDELNRNSPLKPIFFSVDSADLDADARSVASSDADLLKQYSTWVVGIEGHCDERGTREYNVALGMRRSLAVKTYLVLLGVSAARIYTVSYGEEFPSVEGHTELAWSKNRRAQFLIISQ